MENHPQAETAVPPTPEVLPLVGSLSAPNLAFLSLGIAVFLLVVISYTRRRAKSRGNALLLVGSPDSGKTAILSNLAYGQTLPSHTSLQTNSAQIALPPKILRVIDVPGHPRIRDQFREHINDARAVAFVVDCSTVSRNGSVVAEHLHHVLHAITSLPPTQATPALVILAHKTDLLKLGASSNSASEVATCRVRTILERELEKRRASHSGGVGVESLGAEGEGSELGGLECRGGEFRFAEWEGGDVEFVASCVEVGEAKEGSSNYGLDDLRDWLTRL